MNRLLVNVLLIALCVQGCQQKPLTLEEKVMYPIAVQAVTETDSFQLELEKDGYWKSDEVEVQLSKKELGVSVMVKAPNVKLRNIKVNWDVKSDPEVKVLGDVWERSYGDLGWKPINGEDIKPWYAMVSDGLITNGFGVKTGCNTMCYWQVSADMVSLTLDTKSGAIGVELGGRELHAADIVFRTGKEGESSYRATREFCKIMCPDNKYLSKDKYVGWLDWYFTYGNYNAKDFIKETKAFAELMEGAPVKAFSLIDAGWALRDSDPGNTCWHDYQDRGSERFPDMVGLAEQIKETGLIPGIWTRSLSTNPEDTKVKLARNGKCIDPSVPENLEYVKNMMANFRKWGYDFIKHDFSQKDIFGKWGKDMGTELTHGNWTFHDNSKTTAEVTLDLYRAIREGAGDDCPIIGCNTVSHLSAGIFEFYRVGDDSANDLERAMKYGPNGLIFRLPQDGIFYGIDPDCIGNLGEIPWWFNKQLMMLMSKTSGLLYFSTKMDEVTDEHKAAIKEAMQEIASTKEHTLEPIDWMENDLPKKWKDAKGNYKLRWSED